MRLKPLVATLVATFSLSLSSSAIADEGMWQPHQLPELESILKAKGLEIDVESISKLTEFPMNAVISLGGCTASFVSPKGLVVTNHHCVYGSVQYNSTPENNILENGFLAKSPAEDLPAAPGSRVYVTQTVTNVTDKVNKGIEKLSAKARYDAIVKNEKALVAQCEADESYRCNVYSFHGGLEFYLIKSLEIKDVRLSYAPAMGVGKYGGDIDNWMWPRHTGDFGFYRAYVGKDGKPAEYSEDNVPYVPDSYLKVSAKGVQEGDFVMVTGYPGRTNRYRIATEVDNVFNDSYPKARVHNSKYVSLIEENSEDGSKARIAYESTIAGYNNYIKNFGSMIESFKKGTMLERKKQFEQELTQWINSDGERKEQYGSVLGELSELIAQSQEHSERDRMLGYVHRSQMISTARRLYRLAYEKQKPNSERESGYQERDLPRIKAGLERMTRRYDSKVDKAILLHFLELYAALPKEERFSDVDNVFKVQNGFDKATQSALLDSMYEQSRLDNATVRNSLFEQSFSQLNQSQDPFVQYAKAIFKVMKAQEDKSKALAGKLQAARPELMSAIIAFNKAKNKPVYADANSTLRVTYGTVGGYSPQDGLVATPFTSLEGLLAKNTDVDPFNAPKKLQEQIKAKLYGDYTGGMNTVPVNFLSNVDTTGGNSGSPTLNGKAELVGLLFDGVYESIIGDWDYNPELNRSIHVDSRYMLWVMDKVDNAQNLLDEMTIVK
ncbi:S46 family peptidase [Pseudoalteromonas fuliginea]|uniref:Dipeptidyl-peptidase n=1 Tax=Pseudoalteromonas fuliginea TaxID=1872678 RepID=A0ABD3Y3G8_9GAMM|nr:S46 family peptidase [Pseudoalteromonas fuliginea]KDC47865.1 dipeptidyl-peptidase 7 [Pseudoalteromonas fuliginea]KJZ29635.1 dipeptidyl-peptidase 7 [Pseudoalteromonas fuliginea]